LRWRDAALAPRRRDARRRGLSAALDGLWLLTAVATEALAIRGTHVASVFSSPEIIVFVSLCLFLLGGMIYVIIITLILYRWLFERMLPEQLTPSYWIDMGAAAIATLAGAHVPRFTLIRCWRAHVV